MEIPLWETSDERPSRAESLIALLALTTARDPASHEIDWKREREARLRWKCTCKAEIPEHP